jgi:Family of unknown function (DUF6174)
MTELRRALPFLVFSMLLFVAGCAMLPDPLRGELTKPAPPDITAAADAWKRLGPSNYSMHVDVDCFCGGLAGAYDVDVHDGNAVTIRPGDHALNADLDRIPLSVDAMFEHAADVIAGGGTVQLTQAPGGLPAIFAYDPVPDAIDDELTLSVSDLVAAP